MFTLQQWLEACDYKITEGSEFMWQCYGGNTHRLDCAVSSDVDSNMCSVIFDRDTQEIYESELWDYDNERYYKIFTKPEYSDAHDQEARKRGLNPLMIDEDREFTVLDVGSDFLDKTRAVFRGLPYDDVVTIELDMPDSEWFTLMKLAHDRNITLNQLVTQLLEDMVAQQEDQTQDA